MASKIKDNYSTMNITLMEIFNLLVKKFPRNETIKTLQTELRSAISIDRASVYNMSEYYGRMWKSKLLEGDDSFFLTINESDVSDNDDDLIKTIVELKALWIKLQPGEQKIIKEKFASLAMLYT